MDYYIQILANLVNIILLISAVAIIPLIIVIIIKSYNIYKQKSKTYERESDY